MTKLAEITQPSGSDRQRPWQRVCEVLLIFLVFFAIAGDPAPHQNEPYYLCRLKHFWNPSWCPGDFFLTSADAHATFVWTFGWITKWLSLTATAWAGRVFVWSLLAWAWQRLSWRIVPRPLFSVLSAALWVVLIDRCNLAGEWVVGGFESKCVAYVFVLLALYELVNAHWNRVWLLLGAASAFHVLVGGWSVIICAGIWFLGCGGRPTSSTPSELQNIKPDWFPTFRSRLLCLPSMLPGLVVGGALSLFAVIPALRLTWNVSPKLVGVADSIYVFDRLPHHLAILTLPAQEMGLRLTRHGLLIISMVTLIWLRCRLNAESKTSVVSTHDVALRRLTQFAWGAILLAATGLAWEFAFLNDANRAAAVLRYYWFRLTDVAVPLAVALSAVALIATGFSHRRTWAAWTLAAAVAFTAGPLIVAVHQRADNPVPPSESGLASYDDWLDICQWISENTPTDAQFLTLRSGQSFKWRAGRSEIATRKDIPQDAASIVEWSDRLHNIYYHEVDGLRVPADSIAELGEELVTAMAQKYGAQHVLAYRDPALKLPIEYANNTYVVYRIQP